MPRWQLAATLGGAPCGARKFVGCGGEKHPGSCDESHRGVLERGGRMTWLGGALRGEAGCSLRLQGLVESSNSVAVARGPCEILMNGPIVYCTLCSAPNCRVPEVFLGRMQPPCAQGIGGE